MWLLCHLFENFPLFLILMSENQSQLMSYCVPLWNLFFSSHISRSSRFSWHSHMPQFCRVFLVTVSFFSSNSHQAVMHLFAYFNSLLNFQQYYICLITHVKQPSNTLPILRWLSFLSFIAFTVFTIPLEYHSLFIVHFFFFL